MTPGFQVELTEDERDDLANAADLMLEGWLESRDASEPGSQAWLSADEKVTFWRRIAEKLGCVYEDDGESSG